MRQQIACCLMSESTVVLHMQAMQEASARELFRDRVLLDKLCNNPQDFLLDIRQVATLQTACLLTCWPADAGLCRIWQQVTAWNPAASRMEALV